MEVGQKWKIWLGGVFSLALVVSAGLALMNYALEATDKSQRESLLFRAGTIALTIDPTQVQSLAGDASDLNNENYRNLKRSLIEIRSLNTDVRFVYIMGLRNNKQFFYVDSEDPSSEDYSYPGQSYDEATAEDIEKHKQGVSYTSGIYRDTWGEWLSAYAPVKTKEGKVVGLVGLDIEAQDIQLRMDIIQTLGWIIISVISISIMFIMFVALQGDTSKKRI